MRSPPISRVLLRRARRARYDRHSSRPAVTDGLEPPTRGLGEQRRRPPIWRCSGWRLPRFTRCRERQRLVSVALFLALAAARAAAYSGRALPGILLCGARTFLSPLRGSGGLAVSEAEYSGAGAFPQVLKRFATAAFRRRAMER